MFEFDVFKVRITNMSQYFRWINSKYKEEDLPFPPYIKRRSNSLDPRSLEASGLRQFAVLHNNVGFLHHNRLVIANIISHSFLSVIFF